MNHSFNLKYVLFSSIVHWAGQILDVRPLEGQVVGAGLESEGGVRVLGVVGLYETEVGAALRVLDYAVAG